MALEQVALVRLKKLVGAKQDGAIGPKTLQAVMNHDPSELIDKLTIRARSFTKTSRTSKHSAEVGRAATKRRASKPKKCLRVKSSKGFRHAT